MTTWIQQDLFGDEGGELRDAGAAAALAAETDGWYDDALAALYVLAGSGREFTADDVTAVVGMPAHHNAVGGLFIAAANRLLIVPVGYTRSGRTSRHRSVLRTWRGATR